MPRHDGLPRAFDLSRWSYCLDFLLMPPAIVGLLCISVRLDLSAPRLFGLFGAGLLAWSLAEYWIHRSILHGGSLLGAMHDLHHRLPKDFIGVASWGTFAGFAMAWLACAGLTGAAAASSLCAGAMTLYLGYCTIHVSIHHHAGRGFGRYGALMLRLRQGHHRGARGNFGVSSPLWDIVFRTYRP